MGAQQFCFLAWLFVSFWPSAYLGLEAPEINLENTVFVAFAGEELHIKLWLTILANQTNDTLTCSDPLHNQIYKNKITGQNRQNRVNHNLKLKNLNRSGEYVCDYKSATAFWFLHIRDRGYEDVAFDYIEFMTVTIFSGVLLVFSIVASTFVFRGYWKEYNNKGKLRKEDRKDTETTQSNVDAKSSPSASFYASLEPRPRSIYDVLDRSATNTVPDKSRTKPKKPSNIPKNKVIETAQTQHGDESVYENF